MGGDEGGLRLEDGGWKMEDGGRKLVKDVGGGVWSRLEI